MSANDSQQTYTLTNVRIVSGEHIIDGRIVVENGRITAIIANGEPNQAAPAGAVIDGQGGWLLPGFIDVHVHGGYGADFMDASSEAYDTITKFHAAHGTTGLLATTVTAPPEAIEAVLEAAARYQKNGMPYAELLGVHLEGPFLSHKWIGAQNPAHISPPRADWLADWEQRWPGLIRQMTLAPEKEGALPLIQWLRQNNINAACGHSDASYEQAVQAVKAGLNQAAHTYNAMTGLHHRAPGTLGAVLTEDAVYAEIIPDGIHVHPAAIRVLAAAKPAGKLVIITDAMSAAGLGDGLYDLGGLAVVVTDGIARLQEGNNLAGSTLTMNGAIKLMVEQVGMSVQQASRQASGNPAQLLGIAETTGSIAVGKRADLVLLNDQWDVQQTWVAGRTVWKAPV
ncbi:N-acetylglucosamine-6-phosphate deacetylase [Paenibacillus curdlanolyticus YK9]|uniref:N-acetylglucosamine-6-phosphate deacetylase n=1 Tax=Paenibacillus curdlanolyticus YK9 TaxID=717606 RepID=E0IDM8_9BACL|nr:N-acetylglucosamine-6-phosphate deacetylase [Paenibacillus curdlanolyticus]EFM09232.1 N-acetylglucosamine-6-phosphate deacetylase [Paenibacillus curdlanolyticus YK9]